MTPPSKSTEPPSLSNGFASGGDDPRPEDPVVAESPLFDRRGDGRSPPEEEEGEELGEARTCRVCGDNATGMYFGALVCVPCKVRRLCYWTRC